MTLAEREAIANLLRDLGGRAGLAERHVQKDRLNDAVRELRGATALAERIGSLITRIQADDAGAQRPT